MQTELKLSTPKGSRQFSTSASRLSLLLEEWKQSSSKRPRHFSTYPKLRQEALTTSENQAVSPGHIFDLPALPLPPNSNLKHRYDPMVKQFTNLMMRDGKLSRAQRVCPSVPLISRKSSGQHPRPMAAYTNYLR